MNKQHFIKLLKDPVSLKDDIFDLHELEAEFPYCQPVHVLVALANKEAKTERAGQTLNYAAMHVADRGNLKDIIDEPEKLKSEISKAPAKKASKPPVKAESPIKEKKEETLPLKKEEVTTEEKEPETIPVVKKETAPVKAEEKLPVKESPPVKKEDDKAKPATQAITFIPSEDHGEQLREDLIKNLENLRLAKERWQKEEDAQLENEKKPAPPKKSVKKSASAKATGGTQNKKIKSAEKKKITAKSKKSAERKEQPKPVKKNKELGAKSKVKQQQELIEKFIEISPSIKAKAANPPAVDPNQKDLSVPSTSFGENLISENLAEIMVGQGKIEKAIDIYKKLIWKYPQKKAYFAARIEELNK
ncbi:MAG: hypothetical protein ACNS60_09835 [Candidatus Cyclobacteriaceae bacterium M2_1C_046]